MSVDAIRLQNFRGFKDVTLELKPLTVLLGPNSSGKSSFGHALVAAAHCQRRDAGSQRPTLTPRRDPDEWPVDLGTTTSLRTRSESGKVFIGFRIKTDSVELGFGGLKPDYTNLELSYVSHPFVASDSSGVVPVGSENASSPRRNIALSRQELGTWRDETSGDLASIELDGLLVRSMQHIGRTVFAPALEVEQTIRSLLETLTYLRGTRRRPSRGYEDKLGRWQSIGYAGEWTPAIIHRQGGDLVTFAQPPPIPSSVEEARQVIDKDWTAQQQTLLEGVRHWLLQLGLAESLATAASIDKRLIEVLVGVPGQQSHDISDIGLGVSQVLPVLTAGLMQSPGSLFIVDLPEAHLHPLPQARLADFFCSMALSGRQSVVETHSEMFFHWLRLRAEMHSGLRDLIAVYFIDRPKDGFCSEPKPVGLVGNAQLRWPVGFFEEAWDIEARIRVVREARSAFHT